MRPSSLALVIIVATAILTLSGAAHADVQGTCKAAAGIDSRISYKFCVSKLSNHHLSPDADTRGLALIAASLGISNAEDTVFDIKGLVAKPGTGAKAKPLLARCQELYNEMSFVFAEGYDCINAQSYAAGKEKVGEAIPLARQCDDAFAKAAVPSPLVQRSWCSVQMSIICTAITNLIK